MRTSELARTSEGYGSCVLLVIVVYCKDKVFLIRENQRITKLDNLI